MGFFSVLEYDGTSDSGVRSIPHNLSAVPGMIIVKKCTSVIGWSITRNLAKTKESN